MRTKTKIICTIGPAVEGEEALEALVDAGMNVARINFSHGSHASHKKTIEQLKRVRERKGVPLAILLDTKGPEIRLGEIAGGGFSVAEGERLTLVKHPRPKDPRAIVITPSTVVDALPLGAQVLIDDGYVTATVVDKSEEEVVIACAHEGRVQSRKGVNLPSIDIDLPALTEQDVLDITFGVEQGIDLIAASFIRSVDHVLEIKQLLTRLSASDILVLSKIENSLGVQNFEGILQASDGIMVARGDLGVELPLQEVPRLQKMMIRECIRAGKMVVTATQMLESMVKHPRPTRAEVSDVANAIYDSTTAVMLSAETASGSYPLQAVQMMRSIVEQAERDFPYRDFLETQLRTDFHDISSAVALASVKTAYSAGAKAIFCFTSSGSTGRHLSRFRPQMPIVAVTASKKVYHQMALCWGVIPTAQEEMVNAQETFSLTTSFALKEKLVEKGDLVIVTAGIPFGVMGTTNMMLVESIGNVLVRGAASPAPLVRGKISLLQGEKKLPPIRGRIVVLARCDATYAPLLKGAAALVLQNSPEDLDSEQHATHLAQHMAIPLLKRADSAMTLLRDDLPVILDPTKGVIYRA
jgi:pyruvate kinase